MKSALLFRALLFALLSTWAYLPFVEAAGIRLSDKVYLRIEDDYYSGRELEKNIARLKFFYCLYPESIALRTLKKFYESSSGKKTKSSYNDLFSIPINENIKDDKRVRFLMTFLKLFRFLKAQNVPLSPELLKNIKDQIELSGCKHHEGYIVEKEESVKPFYQLEVFLKSRFNLVETRTRKINYQSAFTFLESLDKQYRNEFFN